ncbi:hypothetical protein ELZ97_18500 [Salmonella enterica subsp. enterica serovar Stanleyville]|nr:hypothetical protein EL006_18540 [Salmonella enterica subsp. enterica serovar Stanleyville]AZT66321.1 hypothetical protein ELZ97_18500 [Salmonella enterica subsp. enterica serovar Stanleyville]AZT70484.1 hypothetical protein ELZ68_18510 [Salmonella enterica subsp. enterica serovar Stanleyville]
MFIRRFTDKKLSTYIRTSQENPQLGWGFRKAFSFKPVIKTPFDLLKHLAVWQLQKFNKKSKGGPNGGRKELSAHPMEL